MSQHFNKIKKSKNTQKTRSARNIHKDKEKALPDNLLKFSFKHLNTDKPFYFSDEPGYFHKLFKRIQSLSSFTVKELQSNRSSSLRCHPITWTQTSKPNGYDHLSAQLQQCLPYQFSISSNEYGRVHGFLIDEVFYIVWLDKDHVLYPKKS